jgi:hypothetical protein
MLLLLVAVIISAYAQTGGGKRRGPFPDVLRIHIQELNSILGTPDVIILDVRPKEQYLLSDKKIAGAIHEDPDAVASWAGKYSKDKRLVIY